MKPGEKGIPSSTSVDMTCSFDARSHVSRKDTRSATPLPVDDYRGFGMTAQPTELRLDGFITRIGIELGAIGAEGHDLAVGTTQARAGLVPLAAPYDLVLQDI